MDSDFYLDTPSTDVPAEFEISGDPYSAKVSYQPVGRVYPAYSSAPTRAFPIATYLAGVATGAMVVAFIWLAAANVSFRQNLDDTPQSLTEDKSQPPIILPATPPLHVALSANDLAFGEQQVLRMIADRPEMKRYVKKGDSIWVHCVRSFGGEAIGQHILWDKTLPEDADTDAEHMGPEGTNLGYVRVRDVHAGQYDKGTPLSCEELWSGVVFEMENIRGTKAFDVLYKMAMAGKLTRSQWVRENTRLEYTACVRTAKLSETLWGPIAKSHKIRTTAANWYTDAPNTYEGWIAEYSDPNGYPWSFWGKYYDDEVVPYLKSVGKK